MPDMPVARKGDSVFCPSDVHPEANTAVPVSGQIEPVSAPYPVKDTYVNDKLIAIAGDTLYKHVACPGSTPGFTFPGDQSVNFAEDHAIIRAGDTTIHCGNQASRGQVLPMCSLDTFA